MTLKNSTLFWIVTLLVGSILIIHLLTLSIYPIPWFDETYFASIAKSLLEQGRLYPTVGPIVNDFKDIYIYGPLYFITQDLFIKIFGFGAFAARVTSLIFSLPCCYLLVKIFLSNKKGAGWFVGLLIIGFFFDYTVFENIHMGRMEFMALTFVFGYIFFILKNETIQTAQKYYLNAFLYGLFAALAILTTPRCGILLVAPAILLIYQIAKQRRKEQLIGLVISSVVCFTLFFIWVTYSFGSIPKMLAFYQMVSKSKDIARPFSLRMSIFIYQFPIVLSAFFLSGISILVCGKAFFDRINIISLLSIILFYTFVRIHECYTAFIMPYFYLLTINALYQMADAHSNRILLVLSKLCVYSLLLLMIGLTALKTCYIFYSRKERDPKEINAFIKQNIPAGSRVIGDDQYYYSVLKAGSDFQYMDWFAEDTIREEYQRKVYNYDYIIVSDDVLGDQSKFFKLYNKKAKLELVGRFNPPVDKISSYIKKHRKGLIYFFTYNGYLYHRIKN